MTVIAMCTATLVADPLAAGPDEVRAAGAAALAAGFTEVSVWAHHLRALDGLGLGVGVVEAAMAWPNGDRAAAAKEAERLATLAAEHGAPRIGAVCLDLSIDDLDRARDNLALAVDAAEAVGAQVCLEFLPWSGVPDLATAWALVEPLGPSAGLLLDTWHWVRQPGGPAFDLLATIPGGRIGYLQLCDAAAEPDDDGMTEAMTARLLPGEGVVDFAAVLGALRSIGATPYVATEVFNPGLVAALGPEGAAVAMRDAAERVMVAA